MPVLRGLGGAPRRLWPLSWGVVVAVGCGPSAPEAPPAPGVVARIDSLHIAGTDLRAFAERAPAEGREPSARRQSFLRGLLARHLLATEARSRGLDTTADVTGKVESRWRERVLDDYRATLLPRQGQVSQDEIAAFYDSLGLARQRRVSGILVDRQADARSVLSLLRLGRSFEDLARQRSVHRASAQKGGQLGFVSLEQARSLGLPDSLFLGLPDGEVSPVLPQGERFQIIRFSESRTTALEAQRAGIEALLLERRQERLQTEHVEALARRLHWRLVPAGLAVLTANVGEDGLPSAWLLDPDEGGEPLFAFDGGVVTVREFVDRLGRQPRRTAQGWDVGDSATVARAAAEILQPDLLQLEDARRAGIGQGETDRRWRERLAEDVAITELRRRVLAERVGVTAQDARRFYDEHPELFRQADDAVIVEALVETEEEARSLLAAAQRGESLTGLAAAHARAQESLWESPGTLRLGEHERLTMPALYRAVSAATPGRLTGPVAVEGGFSVFQVIDRQPGTLPAFPRVERRALALAKRQRQERAFDGFVDELFARHADRIHVYPGELERALPDTFLLRLAAHGTEETP